MKVTSQAGQASQIGGYRMAGRVSDYRDVRSRWSETCHQPCIGRLCAAKTRRMRPELGFW
jgi:hypothetical protein